MNRNSVVRVLWQSFMSAVIAGIIYTIIYVVTSKGLNGFIQGALVLQVPTLHRVPGGTADQCHGKGLEE